MSAMTIGPRRAIGWSNQFRYASQFATAPAKGKNTAYPLLDGSGNALSIPVAQAFRYWFAVKSWRLTVNYTVTTPPGAPMVVTGDSGWVPYSVSGYGGEGILTREWLTDANNTGGDLLAAPTLLERYGGKTIGPDGELSDGEYIIVNIGIMGLIGQLYGDLFFQGLLWDDAKPGNVFMAFYMDNQPEPGGLQILSTYYGSSSSFADSGLSCSLDGIPFKMGPGPPAGTTYSGTIALQTRDS